MIQLTEENFVMFAVTHYDNASCTGMKDFENDLKRFKYIKRLLRRYEKKKVLCENLLVNHIVVLHNLFGAAVTPMLFFRIERKFWPQIKTFLVFLNLMPEQYVIENKIPQADIALDPHIIAKLRKVA